MRTHTVDHPLLELGCAVLCALMLAVCSATPGGSEERHDPAGRNLQSLQDLTRALEERGAEVEREGDVDQPFFSPPGVMLDVGGEDVQVFAYESEAARREESAAISADGTTIGTSQVHWIGTPRFWAGGRLLVLYLGDDETVREHLSAVLGSPIAGPSPPST